MRSSKSMNPFEFHRKLGVDTYKNIFKLIEHLKKGKEEIKDFFFFFSFSDEDTALCCHVCLEGGKNKNLVMKTLFNLPSKTHA